MPYSFPSILAAIFLLTSLSQPVHAIDKPNIIFILADDLGYGDVGWLNPDRGQIKTPYLDRLATQGMIFTDAHSGASVCTPTRYGLLTGRYAWRTGLDEGVFNGYVEPLIKPDRLTVAGLVKEQGYHTACIGKWHLGFTVDRAKEQNGGLNVAEIGGRTLDGPISRGFDEFFGFHHARSIKSLFKNDRCIEHIEAIDMLPRLTRQACEHVATRSKSEKPFFLYLALSSPHTPIVPAADWQNRSGLNAYGDFVMQTDDSIGRVLTALEDSGAASRTLVIVSSDNGCSPAAGFPELHKKNHWSSGPFRGAKADVWEGGHRVPFIARWPGTIPPNSRNNNLICHNDFMATCAELLGVQLPAHSAEDSLSFLPQLLDKKAPSPRRDLVHHSINGQFAIRSDNWKLCFCPGSGGWGSPTDQQAVERKLPDVQLYDLESDLAEANNLQEKYPAMVAKLTGLMKDYIARGRSTPGPEQTNNTDVQLTKPIKIKPKKKKETSKAPNDP